MAVRRSLPYQGIARRAASKAIDLNAKPIYDTEIDVSAMLTDRQSVSKRKRRFNIIDRQSKENMKMRPLHDHVIVTRVEPDTVSKGGIYIPPTAQEKTTEGLVIAVGNGVHLENGTIRPLDVKKGDRVLFEKYAGAEVKINGEEFTVLRENNVICVLA